MSLNFATLPEAYDFDTILRELSWLNGAQPIWQSSKFISDSLDKLCQTDLNQAAQDLEQIWAWHGVPRRLGRRFEALITAYLEHSSNAQILGHGLTIYRDKTSIGEIDLIVELNQEIVHVEVALKFYAGINTEQGAKWVGPSCRDHFAKKKMHLLSHQLPVIRTPECINRLTELKLQQPNRSIGLIFGYLLQPWEKDIPLDHDMTGTAKAYWCTHRSFEQAVRKLTRPYGGAYGWTYIPRAQWTAPHITTANLPLLPTTAAPEQADCYVLVPKHDYAFEKLRLFVLSNDFAERAVRMFKEK